MYLAQCCLAVLLISLSQSPTGTTPQSQPQQPPQSQQQPEPVRIDPKDLPVSLDRIQRALAHTPILRFDKDRPVFRVQVFGEKPTIEEILGPDFGSGPVPYGRLTHQEFLNLVTPKDVQGFAPYSNEEGMQLAASSFVLQWTLQKAIRKFTETKDERAREAARTEVVQALDALEKARAKAGMPPK